MIAAILDFILGVGSINWNKFKHWNRKSPAISYATLAILFVVFIATFSLLYI